MMAEAEMAENGQADNTACNLKYWTSPAPPLSKLESETWQPCEIQVYALVNF
jgi:hypothetical protein